MSLPPRVSTFSRVLAWILLILSILGGASWVFLALTSKAPDSWTHAATAILAIAGLGFIAGYVALTGHSPSWSHKLETMYDEEAARRGISTRSKNAGRAVNYAITLIVFGGMLIWFGRSKGLFEGETGWFGMSVFFVAWLIVALILWRNLRKKA